MFERSVQTAVCQACIKAASGHAAAFVSFFGCSAYFLRVNSRRWLFARVRQCLTSHLHHVCTLRLDRGHSGRFGDLILASMFKT